MNKTKEVVALKIALIKAQEEKIKNQEEIIKNQEDMIVLLKNRDKEAKAIMSGFIDFFDKLEAATKRDSFVAQFRRPAIEFLAVKEKQKKAASQPRTDKLQEIIIEIVRKNPKVTVSQLLAQLELYKGQGTIEDFTDGQIVWCDKNGRCKDTPITALKDRLRSARKKLKSL